MNKLQLIEKLEDQSFKERVYLEMINQYPDLDMSLDELDEGLSDLFDKVKRAKTNAKAKKVTADSKYDTKKTKALADAEGKRIKAKSKAESKAIKTNADASTIDSILDIKRKKNDAAIKRDEKRAASKNVKFNNRLRSRAAGAEDVKDMQLDRELARKRKIEDDERNRKQRIKNDHKQTFNSIKNGATNAGKFANKHKKEIGVAAAGAAGLAATGVAVKTIKDRQKFKAWKNINPKKRSNVTYDQWVDLGRPLNENIDNFIEGYFDAIYSE
jgi:hypothetical protein